MLDFVFLFGNSSFISSHVFSSSQMLHPHPGPSILSLKLWLFYYLYAMVLARSHDCTPWHLNMPQRAAGALHMEPVSTHETSSMADNSHLMCPDILPPRLAANFSPSTCTTLYFYFQKNCFTFTNNKFWHLIFVLNLLFFSFLYQLLRASVT